MFKELLPYLVSVTERAAIACFPMIGKGDKMEADRLATETMRETFNTLDISGEIVIGEGERDEAPMLYIGEKVGKGGFEIDIAVDPLEGTNLCADNLPGSITVMAIGEKGSLFNAPDTYMEKIVVGSKVKEKVSLTYSVEDNLKIISKAYEIDVADLVVIVLKRDRHVSLVEEIEALGARIKFISDGDVMAGVDAIVEGSGIHALMGIGAAPEGVITAAAVRMLGGQMEAKLMPYDDKMEQLNEDVVSRMKEMGIPEITTLYTEDDLARSDNLVFIATGVTTGDLISGIQYVDGKYNTETIVIDKNGFQKFNNQYS